MNDYDELDAARRAKHAAYMRNWIRKNPEKWKAIYTRRNAKLRAEAPEYSRYHRTKWRKKKAVYISDKHVEKTYGLNKAEYLAMLDAQGGVCAICSLQNVNGRRLSVDHDHATGKIRALLCIKCNAGLGHFHESLDMVVRAAQYIDKHNRLQAA